MSTLKDVSIIVKWNGKEYPITDMSDQETVAVLKHEIARLTNVRPERQKLLNLKHKGNYEMVINLVYNFVNSIRFYSFKVKMPLMICD